MRHPEYSIIKEVAINNQSLQGDPIEFPSGTLVFVFWSEHYIPSHKKEEMEEFLKYIPEKEMYVMCIIGQYWVPVHRKNIRKNQ